MVRYEYTPLDPSSDDIRLVTILPGKFEDPIQIKITHAPLIPPVRDDNPKRWSLDAITKTLPRHYVARETLEGRVIFRNYEGNYSTWDHPDPNFPREAYDPPQQEDQSQVKFEALSYTWGSPKIKDKATIQTSDDTTSIRSFRTLGRTQRLPITGNLAEALRHLRYEEEPRVMWIDALCINQEDIQERSEQVKRMGMIYTLAHKVVVWLGASSPTSALALSKLNFYGKQIEHTKDARMLSSPGCEEPTWFSHSVAPPWDADVWEAISEICSRGYFRRLWIVQEVHLGGARSVVKCGADEIPWPRFRRAVVSIHNKQRGVPDKVWHRTEVLTLLCEDLFNMTFEDMLKRHHVRPCLDPRDRLYGLLSLAPDSVAGNITPDYKLSLLQVFTDLFLARLEQSKRLTQLIYGGRRASSSSSTTTTTTPADWPTWVPDWSHYLNVTVPNNQGFCATGVSAARAARAGPGRLAVAAVYFASIACPGPKIAAQNFADYIRLFHRLRLDRLEQPERGGGRRKEGGGRGGYPAGGTYRDAWLQTLTLGRVDDRAYNVGFPTLETLYDMVQVARTDEAAAEKKLANGYKIWIIGRVHGCSLFSTHNGYVGMVNGDPQQGDEVFAVLGCDYPMLLRPMPTGEYEVVGDCYVYGLMDGEALFGPVPRPWIVQTGVEKDGQYRAWFYNEEAATISSDHPRLQEIPMPPEWEPVEWERARADPLHCKRFRHKETGEVINSDPRLFPEALKEQGVPIETITLV